MSTNPFRQTNPPKDQLTGFADTRRVVSDGSGPLNTALELSVDTKSRRTYLVVLARRLVLML